jgi:hypothetical protein
MTPHRRLPTPLPPRPPRHARTPHRGLQCLVFGVRGSGFGVRGSVLTEHRTPGRMRVLPCHVIDEVGAGRDVVSCRRATPEPVGPYRRPGPDPGRRPHQCRRNEYRPRAAQRPAPHRIGRPRARPLDTDAVLGARVAPGPPHRPSGVFLFGTAARPRSLTRPQHATRLCAQALPAPVPSTWLPYRNPCRRTGFPAADARNLRRCRRRQGRSRAD